MWIIGLALDRLIKQKAGSDNSLWKFLNEEVYEPIGVIDLPINYSIEADGSTGIPNGAWGVWPRMSELARIGELFQREGAWKGKQILSRAVIDDMQAGPKAVGFATGNPEKPFYYKAFWRPEYKSEKCSFYYPMMDGWGEVYVILLSNETTAVRIAATLDGNEKATNLSSLTGASNQISPLCK